MRLFHWKPDGITSCSKCGDKGYTLCNHTCPKCGEVDPTYNCDHCHDDGMHVEDAPHQIHDNRSFVFCHHCHAGWERKMYYRAQRRTECRDHPEYAPNMPPPDCQWCESWWDRFPKKEDWIDPTNQTDFPR